MLFDGTVRFEFSDDELPGYEHICKFDTGAFKDHGFVITLHFISLLFLINTCTKKNRNDGKLDFTSTTIEERSKSTNSIDSVAKIPPKKFLPNQEKVTKVRLRELAEETSLSRSKLQGSSESESDRPAQPPKLLSKGDQERLLLSLATLQEERRKQAEVDRTARQPFESPTPTLAVTPQGGTPPMGNERETNKENGKVVETLQSPAIPAEIGHTYSSDQTESAPQSASK
uniref:Uncharacterized protein n=1 Tax=Angiostrongylus cantonensis TaxID=6313 RepID=A0A0K0CW42_ANGCA